MATPSDENTRQFMIYAPDELVRAIKVAAVKRDQTASALVRDILQDWLWKNERELDTGRG